MPNSNCLKGIKCPKCGSENKFQIHAQCWVIAEDDGTDEATDFEWGEQDGIICLNCKHRGIVRDFSTKGESWWWYLVSGLIEISDGVGPFETKQEAIQNFLTGLNAKDFDSQDDFLILTERTYNRTKIKYFEEKELQG